jgi:hypothetical protein
MGNNSKINFPSHSIRNNEGQLSELSTDRNTFSDCCVSNVKLILFSGFIFREKKEFSTVFSFLRINNKRQRNNK